MNTIQPLLVKKLAFLFALIFLFSSCQRDTDCFTPPAQVQLELVNSGGQNLIKNGTIDEKTVKLEEQTNEGRYTPINYTLTEEMVFIVRDIGWQDGIQSYRFTSDDIIFDFHVKSSSINTKNCAGHQIDEVKFHGVNSRIENGIFKIIPE